MHYCAAWLHLLFSTFLLIVMSPRVGCFCGVKHYGTNKCALA